MKLPYNELEHDLLVEKLRTLKLINGYLSGAMLVGVAYLIYKIVGLFA
jgi:hypothetical protein